MSVRRAAATPAVSAPPSISHADRLRFSRLALPAEPTGVNTRSQAKRHLMLDKLPSKETLLRGYYAMEWLMQYSRKMSETDGKYIHDGEWNGPGNSSYFSAFNYLLSNEPFLRDMLREYGSDLFKTLDAETEEKRMMNSAFIGAMVALNEISTFQKEVPNYLDDREIFGEFSSWPDEA